MKNNITIPILWSLQENLIINRLFILKMRQNSFSIEKRTSHQRSQDHMNQGLLILNTKPTILIKFKVENKKTHRTIGDLTFASIESLWNSLTS